MRQYSNYVAFFFFSRKSTFSRWICNDFVIVMCRSGSRSKCRYCCAKPCLYSCVPRGRFPSAICNQHIDDAPCAARRHVSRASFHGQTTTPVVSISNAVVFASDRKQMNLFHFLLWVLVISHRRDVFPTFMKSRTVMLCVHVHEDSEQDCCDCERRSDRGCWMPDEPRRVDSFERDPGRSRNELPFFSVSRKRGRFLSTDLSDLTIEKHCILCPKLKNPSRFGIWG